MNTNYFFILLLFIIPVKLSSIIPETIQFQNENITINNISKLKSYFRVVIPQKSNLPNYIKVEVNYDDQEYSLSRCIINFFQEDATFKNIKQSSNALPTSYIWLNKAQIKNGFYFSVESIYPDNKYQIQIIPTDYIELTFESNTYSYNISKDNQVMEFKIKGENNLKPELSDKLIIWAYSKNKNLKVYFNQNISDYQKHSKYNAFIIKNLEYKEYILTIKDEIGDFIDIGFICLNVYNFCKNCKNENKILYYGFLKKDYLNTICFAQDLSGEPHIKLFDDVEVKEYIDSGRNCLLFPFESKESYELFFSYYYLYLLPPLKSKRYSNTYYLPTGITTYEMIGINESMKFIPLKLENNFDYITYYIKIYNMFYASGTKANVYISTISNDNKEKIIPLKQNLEMYTYTLYKDKMKEFLNPIEHRTNMLTFECKVNRVFCYVGITIFTDKTKFDYFDKFYNDYLLFRNNKINGFLGSSNLFVEKLSGDISFSMNQKYLNYYNYKNNYYIEGVKNLDINILSKKNSIYRTKIFSKDEHYFILDVGNNFFFKLEKNQKYYIRIQARELEYTATQLDLDEDIRGIYSIYTNFYPIDCNLNLKIDDFGNKYNIKGIKIPHTNNKIFYQNISTTIWQHVNYEIYPKDIIKGNSCFLYLSSYNMNSTGDFSDNSIILKENQPQLFAFDKNVKTLNFSYYFAEIREDLRINVNLLNKGNYNMILFIDNSSNKFQYEFKSNKEININGKDLYNFCVYENQICKIFFNITKTNDLKLNDEESIIEININNINQIKENKISIKLFKIFLFTLFVALISYSLYKLLKIKKLKTKEKDGDTDGDLELIDINNK